MTVNAMEAAAGAVRAAHREQCFDAIRRALGLGDTKGDTGAWLDWIDAVMGSRSADEVVRLTMEQKRIEGTLGSKLPPVNWRKADVKTRRPSRYSFTPGPWHVSHLHRNIEIESHQDGVVATLDSRSGRATAEGAEANAHLIATAPDLFRFVEAFAACPTEGEVPGHWSDKDAMDRMIRTAREIVAKATRHPRYPFDVNTEGR